MGKAWQDFGIQTAQSAVGGIMGLALGGINDRRQLKQQEKLQKLEIQGQQQMVDYNTIKQLEMWKNTNYQAQMEELRKAGLNPAMIYGMSGGGATTTGQSTGNVTGSHAPTGGGEVIAMGQTMSQLGLMRAQRENIEAQTELLKTQKPKTEAETTGILQGVENAKAQQKLTELQTEIGNVQLDFDKGTLENRKSTINLMLSKLIEETKIMENERLISDQTIKTKVGLLRQELALKYLEAWRTNAETRNINQATIESVQRVSNMIQENMRQWDKMHQTNLSIDVQKGMYDDTGLPQELKEVLNNILIIPRLGGTGHNPIKGFHKR